MRSDVIEILLACVFYILFYKFGIMMGLIIIVVLMILDQIIRILTDMILYFLDGTVLLEGMLLSKSNLNTYISLFLILTFLLIIVLIITIVIVVLVIDLSQMIIILENFFSS